MEQTWLGLIRRFVTDEFGPVGGHVALIVGAVFVLGVLAMPFISLICAVRISRWMSLLELVKDQLERLSRMTSENSTLAKESASLIRERLGGSPPPTRFGPDPQNSPASGTKPQTEGHPDSGGVQQEGRGIYDYCPSCKSIQYVKFMRCQACGFHLMPSR